MHSGPGSQAGDFAWRCVFDVLSPRGARARLTILILHRVRAEPDALFPNELHAASFRERVQWLQSWFNVIPLRDAAAALERGTLPRRALAITFDDGYADNASVALPILAELGAHATFFVSTGFVDGGQMWNDSVIEFVRAAQGSVIDATELGLGVHAIDSVAARRQAIVSLIGQLKYLPPSERAARVADLQAKSPRGAADPLMMTSEQVRQLASRGMTIGAHTVSHPILARVDAGTARREIADSRDFLQGLVREPVSLFAYPNGKPVTDYGSEHVGIVKDLGFRAAVSTAWGAASPGDPMFELPRFTPWGRTRFRWASGLARNFGRRAQRAAAVQ